jgi:PilZ domain
MSKPTSIERRKIDRHNVSYYLAVMDTTSQQIIGHLIDISPIGLMMDSKIPVPTNLKYTLHLDLMEEIAGQASVEFVATSIWCRPDAIQPYLYNAGFHIIEITPGNLEVVKQIAKRYGGH